MIRPAFTLWAACLAAPFLFASAAPHPAVPPDALHETVQAPPQSAPPPTWLAHALTDWRIPWTPQPGHYDHRYITW
jgi:hypothetical protein